MPPARLPEHFHWLTVQRKCKRAQWKLAFKLPSAGFLLQRYNKKQLFAIVCSDFVLKSAHIFNIYTENQVVTKPLNISHLKKESVSFLSKSFLSFSKNKNTFHLYKEYIYKYIFIYIFFIELFVIFKIENDKNDFDKNDKVSRLFVRFLKVIIWMKNILSYYHKISRKTLGCYKKNNYICNPLYYWTFTCGGVKGN